MFDSIEVTHLISGSIAREVWELDIMNLVKSIKCKNGEVSMES